ncbi:hypothetical protein C3Y89_26520 [Rhizobium sp. UPM1132]|uniref:Uncharacterized protein n=1 Tax=Rhizobium leguminosarum TaxID=384 RepID=A0A4Q8XYI0_RHILE|nr:MULTISPECIES: hypothetical protein [Rhizobium]MDV4156939.1 hypothetical protein [Rhizobium brockwellii]NKQ73845.1 hypothetical protein [Rhizobium ruizarguesonis]NKQ85175.1 hypothetical protein [Rhizobium ruizarguesonis]TAX71817.1 hypothetical protein ELI03_08730 [Rhizobium leguminosarum]
MSEDQENRVVISTGQQIAIGDVWWELRDNSTKVDYVDIISEARQFNGVIHLSLGGSIQDANNLGVVSVTNRIRMNLVVAQSLHSILGQMITDALKPADKSQAN